MLRNLILTGGIRHDFEAMSAGLDDVLRPHGVTSEISFDIEGGLSRLGSERFGMVTVYALRWRMLTGEKYAPFRNDWAFELSETGRDALVEHVRNGGGLLALHTACLCFDGWNGWRDLIGGAWEWGRSSHPPLGAVAVSHTAVQHPITAGLPDFNINDEVFSDLDVISGVEPLLVAAAAGCQPQPIFWTRQVGAGRVVFDALGHDTQSLGHPVHAALLGRAAQWLAGQTPGCVG